MLGQRRARILREELREGSNLFTIHAFLPAEASFGFVDDMRRRSSGAASASLMLSHWERLQVSQNLLMSWGPPGEGGGGRVHWYHTKGTGKMYKPQLHSSTTAFGGGLESRDNAFLNQ